MARHHRPGFWTNTPLSIAAACAAGCCGVLALSCTFSALTFFVLEGIQFAGTFSAAALVSGAYFGSWLCGKFRRRRGLAEGIICGAVLYGVLSAAGLLAGQGLPALSKLILLLVAGAAGGVSGVNSKRPKSLHD